MEHPYSSQTKYILTLLLLAVYLLTFSGKLATHREQAHYLAGQNLALIGQAQVNQLAWLTADADSAPAFLWREGKLYTPLAPSLVLLAMPFAYIGQTIAFFNPLHLALLLNPVLTALTVTLLVLWHQQQNFSSRTSILISGYYGLCTPAWLYARGFTPWPALALLGLVSLMAVMKSRSMAKFERGRLLFLSGLATGLGLTLGFEGLVILLIVGAYIVSSKVQAPSTWVIYLSPIIVNVIGVGWFYHHTIGLTYLKQYPFSLKGLMIICLPLIIIIISQTLSQSKAYLSRLTWLILILSAPLGFLFNLYLILTDISAPILWRPTDGGWPALHLILPPFAILLFALLRLMILYRHSDWSDFRLMQRVSSPTDTSTIWLNIINLFLLTQFMLNTAHLAAKTAPYQTEQAMLEALKQLAAPEDQLLISTSTPESAQTIARWASVVQQPALPTTVVHRSLFANNDFPLGQKNIWLYEPQSNIYQPLTPVERHLNQTAYLVDQIWLDPQHKLAYYATPKQRPASIQTNVPFQGGISLLDFAYLGLVESDPILKVRFTWQAETTLTAKTIITFLHLLNPQDTSYIVAQSDRLLYLSQNLGQSPLTPAQTLSQGYGLRLPADIKPGGYPLIMGLYDAQTQQRLLRADGSPDDFLYLTTVQVGH